jgi:Ca2+/Na+ antiporter
MAAVSRGIITRKIQLDPLRHRFHNKAALLLTAATFVLLITLSVVFGEFDNSSSANNTSSSSSRWLDDNGGDYSQFSCRYIYDQVPDAGYEQCQFARACNDGEGVWAPFVFCHYNKFSAVSLFLVISPIMIVWMVTLFRLLGSTAEDFFSPSLEMFSVKLGLPPRFAGVTLLALGNGAADVSATISAIVNDVDNGYKFSLGALTGAAMLVGGVVAGIVVLVADGVPCRGALVRDIAALLITVCVVWANLSTGKIGAGSITLFLSMYAVFVCIVLTADIYHRAVVLPRIRALQAHRAADGTVDEAALQTDATNLGPPAALSRVITAISNYDNICQRDNTVDDDSNAAWGVSSGSVLAPTPQLEGAALQEADAPIILHGQNGLLTPERHNHTAEQSATTPPAEAGGSYELINDQIDQGCVADGSLGFSAMNWSGALHDCKQEVMASLNETWEDVAYNGDLNKAEKAMLICEFPFTILRKVRLTLHTNFNIFFVVVCTDTT